MIAQIKKLSESAVIPMRGSNYAAGYDLYANVTEPVNIEPGAVAKIGTGLSITPPTGYFGAIFARSGLATKQGLRPANCVGVCDEDYTGEYIVAMYNDSNEIRTINAGDRIAQLVFLPYIDIEFQEVSELQVTARGDKGFGSTGSN